MKSSFADLGIGQPFTQILSQLEYSEPTPVQARAIPMLLERNDLIACAPTGTGKTAAFLLPALTRLVADAGSRGRGPRVLVLTPTRELAAQVAKAAQSLTRGLRQLTTVCVTGGEPYAVQNRLLSAPHEILVATPGRLMDQLRTGRIHLGRVETLVLDEADRMLDMGFSDDVLEIAGQTPAERQTVCFTATLSQGVRDLAGRLLRDPQWLDIARESFAEQPIDQHVVYSDGLDHKYALLSACLADDGLGQAIVFTSTKREAEQLADRLYAEGHAAGALHGDLTQRERGRAMNRLRSGDWRVLVATDVAARGLDVRTITHVINFDLPRHAEDYVHRVGRTGRAGATGQAVSFVGRQDLFAMRRIEQFIGRPVQVSKIDGLEAQFDPSTFKPRSTRPGGPRRPYRGNGAKGASAGGEAGRGGPDRRGGGGGRRGAPQRPAAGR